MIKENAINIILDSSRQKQGVATEVLFIEIETDDGRSVRVGEYIPGEQLDRIRITASDIGALSDEGVMQC